MKQVLQPLYQSIGSWEKEFYWNSHSNGCHLGFQSIHPTIIHA